MTKEEYEEYEQSVQAFMVSEGINCLSRYDDSEPSFSWRQCDCCRSALGGDRHKACGYNPTEDVVYNGYHICNDCLYYAAYGRLDDMTMLDMKD